MQGWALALALLLLAAAALPLARPVPPPPWTLPPRLSHELSEDGRWLVWEREGELWLTDLQGGTRRLVPTADGACSAPRISADGRRVVFVSEAANLVPGDDNVSADVFLLEPASGRLARLPVRGGEAGQSSSFAPAFDPQGNLVLAGSYGTGASEREVVAWRVDTPEALPLGLPPRHGPALGRAALNRELQVVLPLRVASYGKAGTEMRCELWCGQLVREEQGWSLKSRRLLGTDAWSPDLAGPICAYVQGGRLLVRDLARPAPQEVPGSSGALEPSLSADGRLVAFTAAGQVRLYDRVSGRLQAVGPGRAPSLAGDGRALVYRRPDSSLELWTPAGRRPLP